MHGTNVEIMDIIVVNLVVWLHRLSDPSWFRTVQQTHTNKDLITYAATQPLTTMMYLNLLTLNINNSGRTAPLSSKVAFYIFIQQI